MLLDHLPNKKLPEYFGPASLDFNVWPFLHEISVVVVVLVVVVIVVVVVVVMVVVVWQW